MFDWLRRRQQRDFDLARGVDADLVTDNRSRFRLAACLFAVTALLVIVDRALHLTGWLHTGVVWTSVILLIASVVIARWAAAESSFLHSPDPKEPPSVFKP
jgi:hypothetical protein